MDAKPQYWSPKTGEKGMTELHYAAYCQDLAGIRYWIEQGLDVNQKDKNGWTPLVWAIDMAATGAFGTAEAIVDYLIEQGAELEFSNADYGSLLEFAHSRDTWVAEHLEKILKKRV
jgi:ankyrin repeat protein